MPTFSPTIAFVAMTAGSFSSRERSARAGPGRSVESVVLRGTGSGSSTSRPAQTSVAEGFEILANNQPTEPVARSDKYTRRVACRQVDLPLLADFAEDGRVAPDWLDELTLKPGPPWLAMGTRGLDPAGWLVVDDRYAEELAEKDRLLAARHEDVFGLVAGVDTSEAAAEVLALVTAWLGAH